MLFAATPTPSPASGNPLNALTVIFGVFALVVLALFLVTGLLAYRNRHRRGRLERVERPKQQERFPSIADEVHKVVEPGARGEKHPTSPHPESKEYDNLLDERAHALTIGDLVMSRPLREKYVRHARTHKQPNASDADPEN